MGSGYVATPTECESPSRVARRLFAFTIGYANYLLLQRSKEAAEAALVDWILKRDMA